MAAMNWIQWLAGIHFSRQLQQQICRDGNQMCPDANALGWTMGVGFSGSDRWSLVGLEACPKMCRFPKRVVIKR
jgi:hypothetical protein